MLKKLENKKYIALIIVLILVMMIIGLNTINFKDQYSGLVKIGSAKIERVQANVESAGVANSHYIKSYDVIKYNVFYTLDKKVDAGERKVIITASLSEEESNYAEFKEIHKENILCNISQDKRNMIIEISNVEQEKQEELTLEVLVKGAPNNFQINPKINIKESTEKKGMTFDELQVMVKTNNIKGVVKEKESNLPVEGLELKLIKDNDEIKRTYTNSQGEYIFSDIEQGNYKIDVVEDNYELGETVLETGDNSANLYVKKVEPFEISVNKYIKRVKIVNNGETKEYSYSDLSRVNQSVKKLEEITGEVEYSIKIKNISKREGTITNIKEEIPEGLKFIGEKNAGWKLKNNSLYNEKLEGIEIKPGEEKELTLILDIQNTNEARNYITKVTISSDLYENVVYIVDGKTYKEDTVLNGEKITELVMPNNEAKKFSGWYTDKNYTNKYNFSKKVTKNLILYGKYNNVQKNKYIVTFVDGLNGEVLQTGEYEEGTIIDSPKPADKLGYSYDDWYEKDENNNYKNTSEPTPITVSKNIILYSKYNINKYNITYYDVHPDTNKITKIASENVEYGKTVTKLENAKSSIEKKEGYQLVGFKLENGEDFDKNTKITNDVKLYSHYIKVTNGVIFDDEGRITTQQVQEGKTATAIDSKGKEGYTFSYWSLNTENPQKFNFNTKIMNPITLYAIYKINNYTLTINPNGGIYNGNLTEEVTYNNTKEISNPTKEGYTFSSWTVTDTATNDLLDSVLVGKTITMPAKNITLTANYVKEQYEVTFHDGNNILGKTKVEYGNKVDSIDVPGKSNNIFLGWTLDGVMYDFNLPVTRNIDLYSKYELVEKPKISHTPTEWTRDPVTVTIGNTNHPEYSYKYKIGENEYLEYSSTFVVDENTTIVAKSEKNSVESEIETHQITNIDKIKPVITNFESSNVTPSSFDVNIGALDNESGLSEIRIYKDDQLIMSYPYTSNLNEEKIVTYTFNGLNEKTKYKIRTEAVDKVGNVSDLSEKEVETTKKIIVARIIGRNNNLYENEEDYELFESLENAISACANKQCTIQMLLNTNESVKVTDKQDITLDLNGNTITGVKDFTIQNNGSLLVKDDSESIGKIVNTKDKAIINTGVFTLGENNLNVSIEKPNIVGNNIGIQNSSTFNFYTGRVEGITAVDGKVNDTPYLYNAKVTEESGRQIAILQILADAEATKDGVYYTQLLNAVGEASNGTITEKEQSGKIMQLVVNKEVYGFDYNSVDDTLISNNINRRETTANSYINLDLTNDLTDSQLIINAETLCNNRCKAFIIVNENKDTPLYSDTNGRMLYLEQTKEASDYKVILSKGKKYYIHLGFYNVDDSQNSKFKINSIKLATVPKLEYSSSDVVTPSKYGFSYNDGVLTSNNQGQSNTTANSYIKFDMTNEIQNKEILINAEISSENSDYGYITLTDSETIPSYDNPNGRVVYISGNVSAKDYLVTLEAGKVNYIHFGYKKNNFNNSGSDTFTINNIRNINDYKFEITNIKDEVIRNENASTVKLLKDVSLSEPMKIDETKNMILDLNGKTLTIVNKNYVIENNGKLKIIDNKYSSNTEDESIGSILSSTSSVLYNKVGADLTIEKVNIIGNSPTSDVITNEGTLTLGDSSIVKSSASNVIGVNNKNTGNILPSTGTISMEATSSSQTGMYNDSKKQESLEKINIIAKNISSYAINNISTSNLKIGDINIESEGFGILNSSQGIMEISNSNLKLKTSSQRESILNLGKLNIHDFNLDLSETSNYRGTLIKNESKGILNINNSEITNNNRLLLDNSGTATISDSKLSATINNDAIQNRGTLSLNNSTLNGRLILTSKSNTTNTNVTINTSIDGINIDNNAILNLYGTNKIIGKDNKYTGIYCRYSAQSWDDDFSNTFININDSLTIEGYQDGIVNKAKGTLTLGTKNGNIDDSIIIKGSRYGVKNTGIFNYYNGKIIGSENQSLYGTINDIKENTDLNVVLNDSIEETTLSSPKTNIIINETTNTKYSSINDALLSVSDNELTKLKLLDNIKTTNNIVIENEKNIQLDLAGYKITSYKSGTFIENKGILKLIDSTSVTGDNNIFVNGAGEISGYTENPIENKGTLYISGITIKTNALGYSAIHNTGVLNILEGEINANSNIIQNDSSGIFNISGGTFILNPTKSNYSNIILINASTGDNTITNGTFTLATNNSISITGIKTTAGSIEISGGSMTKVYNGIENSNSSNLVINNMNITASRTGISNTATLLVNNVAVIDSNAGISNDASGVLEIKNANITGTFHAINHSSSTTLNIYNGVYKSKLSQDNAPTISNSGSGIINLIGGEITSLGTSPAIANTKNGTINIGIKGNLKDDGTLDVSKTNPLIKSKGKGILNPTTGTINFYDGIVKAKVAITGAIGEIENGYSIVTTSEDDLEVKYLDKKAVAKIKSTNKEYYSLQEAIDNVDKQDETIEILDNIDLLSTDSEISIPSSKNLTIDIMGYKISSGMANLFDNQGVLKLIDSKYSDGVGSIKSSNGSIIKNTGEITIKDISLSTDLKDKETINNSGRLIINSGKVESYTNVILNNASGIFNINGGEILLSEENCAYGKAIINHGTGKSIITSGTISALKGKFSRSYDAIGIYTDAGIIQIDNATINASSYYTSYAISSSADVIINNGIMNENISSSGTLTINDGKILGVINNSGTASINGGTITGYILNGNIFNIAGGTISNSAGYDEVIRNSNILNMTGGKVVAQNNKVAIRNLATLTLGVDDDSDISNSNLIVSSNGIAILNEEDKIFNYYDGILKGKTAVSGTVNDIKNNYSIISNISDEIETKTLGKENVAKIKSTNVEYFTLEDALDAANSGETIELLRNITITATENAIIIPENKNIILDINGKKIENGKVNFIENNGLLKLIDSVRKDSSNSISGKITSTSNLLIKNNGELNIENILLNNTHTKGSIIDNYNMLNLNNSYIESDNNIIKNNENGQITVENSELYVLKEYKTIILNNKGNITINSGVIKNKTNNGTAISNEAGIVQINGGELSSIKNKDNLIVKTGNIENIENNATCEISGGTINTIYNYNSKKLIIENSTIDSIKTNSSLEINETVINNRFEISDGITNMNNVTITSKNANGIVANQGTLNIRNSEITVPNGIAITKTSSSEKDMIINLLSSVTINASTAINNGNNGRFIVNIGIKDGNVNIKDPVITGTEYGIYNNYGTINYYDGVITGATDKAIFGTVSDVESGYKISTEKNDTQSIATLGLIGETESVAKVNGLYYGTLENAIKSVPTTGVETSVVLTSKITLQNNITIKKGQNIKLYLNGYTIEYNGYNFIKEADTTFEIIDGSAPTTLLSNIVSSIKDVLQIDKVSKNIIVYEMNDGTKLLSDNEYKLYKEIDGTYNELKLTKEEYGKYTRGLEESEMIPIKGRLYLQNMETGNYKIISSEGKEMTFNITSEGKIYGNVRENYNLDTKKFVAVAVAELIITIQTGMYVTRYVILSILIVILIILLVLLRKQRIEELQRL